MGELSVGYWATLREGWGSSCRMELTGLDLPERATLSGERCLGTGRESWVFHGASAVPPFSPQSTIKLHRRSAGSSASGGGTLAIGGAGHGSQVCLVWPALCFKRSWNQPFT